MTTRFEISQSSSWANYWFGDIYVGDELVVRVTANYGYFLGTGHEWNYDMRLEIQTPRESSADTVVAHSQKITMAYALVPAVMSQMVASAPEWEELHRAHMEKERERLDRQQAESREKMRVEFGTVVLKYDHAVGEPAHHKGWYVEDVVDGLGNSIDFYSEQFKDGIDVADFIGYGRKQSDAIVLANMAIKRFNEQGSGQKLTAVKVFSTNDKLKYRDASHPKTYLVHLEKISPDVRRFYDRQKAQ